MIKVTINSSNKVIDDITIKGHANYADAGKDIICASVSSIVTTSINGIISLDSEAIIYQENDGFVTIKNVKKDETTNQLLENLVSLLEDLAGDYSKNIQVKRGNL